MSETQMTMFEEFQKLAETPADQVTISQVEALIKEYKQARDRYDEAKKLASEANAKVEELENTVMGMLENLGKTSYEVEGLGRVTKCTQLVYKTPKTNEEKVALFDYITDKYGEGTLTAMVSINHQTLNSWANKEMGELGVGKIPGLEAPTSMEYLQLRSKK